MKGRVLRGVIVGASTLLGKELADELASAPGAVWELALLDDGEAPGQMMSAGDEAMVIQPVTPEAFHKADVVFFAGDTAGALKHAGEAQAGGANIVDLTGALVGREGMVLYSPWTTGQTRVDLSTVGVVSANAAALMLAVVADRLGRAFGSGRMLASVLQPASQQGSAGLDELHQQTVGLLSFGAVPKELYDSQVAFSVRSAFGPAAKADLAELQEEIARQFAALLGGDSKVRLSMQLLQAPVFHGFTASVFVEGLGAIPDVAAMRDALAGEALRVVSEEPEDGPSNQAVAGQTEVLVHVAATDPGEFWMWMAADNLRLVAHHAAACAAELVALRPQGELQ